MRGNRRWGYPWSAAPSRFPSLPRYSLTDDELVHRVFMNDEPFDQEFMDGVKSITRSEVHFHVIPKEHWSYPEWINQTYAAEERQKMVDENVICEFAPFCRSEFSPIFVRLTLDCRSTL